MSADRYVCCDERRRDLLAAPTAPAGVSGIDYIEVHQGATTLDPTFIDIVLVKPLTLPQARDLKGANIVLSGGVRFRAPRVDAVLEALPALGGVERYRVQIAGGQPTDFSTYRLAIVAAPGSTQPPSFLDQRLSAVDFSFKVACPTDFDCEQSCDEPAEPTPQEPALDYRARDYATLRRLMLDRLAELLPGFREDEPLDFLTTLVEAAAYRADQQSYRLDWVGTEAFLGTARSRTSVARHARLIDYPINEGASARVFVRLQLDASSGVDGVTLAASTPLLVRQDGLPTVVSFADYRRSLSTQSVVFETCAPATLWTWRNSIAFHTWGDDACVLPRGATAATLVADSAAPGALVAGDFLLLEEVASPETASPADARADRRHVVRLTSVASTIDVLDGGKKLVEAQWALADALPFDLVVQARGATALQSGAFVVCAAAAGNIQLADHGASLPPKSLALTPAELASLRPSLRPPMPIDDEAWRPVVSRPDIARVQAVELARAPQISAQELLAVDSRSCAAMLQLDDDFGVWEARRDLLESSTFTREFVIESGIDGHASLRFGDGINGLAPTAGAVLSVSGRFGLGPEGNLGHDALAHVVLPVAQGHLKLIVSNPLPARGGTAKEPISAIRIAAPEAFREPQRAVTVEDYASAAMRHPEASNAVAVSRWTGAWQTVLLFVDRKGGLPVDAAFRRTLLRQLEFYRLMGFDVAVRGALAAPLDIELMVCAKPGELKSQVATRVRNALRPIGDASGRAGFFHPDHLSFGSPLYLSALLETVMRVPGVQSVTPRKFQRLNRVAQNELVSGVIRPGSFEVLQLEDDASFPEKGRLVLAMGGGR